MSELPRTARVVIIGGGAVGVSTLYHLALEGWTDCVLLEKNELTAGSTWHAAGNCPNFSASWAVMNMQRYGLSMYRELAERVDYPMNYHVTGSLRLAHGLERMREFEHVCSLGRTQGVPMEMMTVEEMQEKHPFREGHDLSGGLWDPLDGDIDPAQLTQAMAKGARDLGATITRFCPATGVRREGHEWVVETPKGEIRCEKVVNAAGYYAQRVGEWFRPYGGRRVPLVVMSHQYFLTDEIPEIEAWTKEQGRKLPIIRDVDISYYLRQDKAGLNLGPYERNCKAHWLTPEDPMPDDFSFQLYPDDLERLEFYIEDALARVPLLGSQGVGRVINGPIPYAPDGNPMIGPMPGVRDAYEAHSFTFGIAQGGGAGKVAAEWIVHGQTEWDMWAVDPRRYTKYADDDYAVAKGMEIYGHEYAMHFPHHAWPAGRDKKHGPVHDRLAAAGAQFGAYNGWERANWFAKPGDDTSEEATQTWNREGPWEPRIREECEAVRDAAGVIDICGFSRFNLKGEGAADWLRSRIAGGLPKVGRLSLAYFPDERGRIVTEMSVIRHGEDSFTLITAAAAQWHDFELLAKALPADGSLTLTDHTEEYSTLLVTGPESRSILAQLTDGDLSLPWLSHQAATVAGKPAALARVSFAGELGWEIHGAFGEMGPIWDAVTQAGAKPFGMYALNSLRMEKGYRAWKGDLSTDYTLLEGGLDRFIRFNKEQDFPGRAALLAEKQRGPSKRFATMLVEANGCDAPYMSNVWKGTDRVGEVTSSGWGYRIESSIALAMLTPEAATPGTALEVEIYGERRPAVVQADGPLWDPENARIRA
ncbi:MAG: FAD-dependent oxidoreductase [Pseudomonadota bacterium]